MNSIVKTELSTASLFTAAWLATPAGGSYSEAVRTTKPIFPYTTSHEGGTFSAFTASLVLPDAAEDELFQREIAAFYARLLARQEPLGAEFEAIWDANTDLLYEA